MNMRQLFTRILTVSLLAATLAAAGTFKFELSDKVQAGQTQLQPGKYSLAIDGSTAVLKDSAGKTIDVKAKVEQLPVKANATLIGFGGTADAKKLVSVTPRGTNFSVVFE
jgi:tartrate dehydratase beta subunit/fumarate hydratase class I family protein